MKCDSCVFREVCKYKESYLETMESVKNITEENECIKVDVSCSQYKKKTTRKRGA